MVYSHILLEKIGKVGILRLNRPEIRNALVMEMRIELIDALEQLKTDDSIKTIILTGEGKAFSAGGDLSALKELNLLDGRKRLQRSYELLYKILEIEKPIIAAVNGPAAGAGCNLALACDLVLATDQSFFVQSFVNVGLIPDFGGIHFLPMLVGPHRAKELMFLGERVSADEAYRIGLVNRIVPANLLMEQAMELAERLSDKSSISIGFTKKLMNQHLHVNLRYLLEQESTLQDLCFQTADFQEGVAAFFEKRDPVFKGK